ncbi:phage holin, LLH family [Weissella cibaria]|uniref:phage holin, LLH family n=1 Tax=Weissella cibaria TaxID=137591 RepID=UPI002554595E|nr:phage holin, LLH family [Weissella cibaria]MDK9677249.1 phage holin, LLH family [Weissella cibaria]
MDKLIELLKALWEVGILPALLILAIVHLRTVVDGNAKMTTVLDIAEKAVEWAEDNFDGGAKQKAEALKYVSDKLLKLDKAHLFTASEINTAIEWAVLKMEGMD